MDSMLAEAVENNADFCDLVCRANGLTPKRSRVAWTCAVRTPDLYPDAITLSTDATADSILSEIDLSQGCSVKDSFATLDLHPYGFSILFDATWIGLSGPPLHANRAQPEIVWERLTSPINFAEWIKEWGRINDSDALVPALLTERAIDFVWARNAATILGGAIVNRSIGVVGISNFFALGHEASALWASVIDHVRRSSPSGSIVGYTSGPELAFAFATGFESLGPLRIWVK